jgi:hypothetical protein
VDLERGPLSLVRITEELREWKSSGCGSRKPRLTAVGIRCADHGTPSIRKKLALTSPTSGGLSVGIVSLRTKATEFSTAARGARYRIRRHLYMNVFGHFGNPVRQEVQHLRHTRVVRTPAREDRVSAAVERELSRSSRNIARQPGISKVMVVIAE